VLSATRRRIGLFGVRFREPMFRIEQQFPIEKLYLSTDPQHSFQRESSSRSTMSRQPCTS
jgi:hypothetical protein